MPEVSAVSAEKLAEIQADLDAVCAKHNVDIKPTFKLEMTVTPKEVKAEEAPKEETA